MATINLVYAAFAIFILDALGFQIASATPDPVEPFYLISTGEASDKYPELMGVYQQSEEILNNFPVFKQVDGPGNIFVHKIGIWVVSKTLDESDKRPLMWTAEKSSPMPYRHQWRFYDEDCLSGTRPNARWDCSYSLDGQTRLDGYGGRYYVWDDMLRIVSTQSGSSEKVLQLFERYFSRYFTQENWKYYLPDDIDSDQNGEISQEEIELKIKDYIKYVFDHLDKDTNNIISQEEFDNANIDMDIINKIVDIAFKSFPLKMFLGHGDRNQDGFISEDDLLLPEKIDSLDEADGDFMDAFIDVNKPKGNWTVKASVLQKKERFHRTYPVCADSIGTVEGEVICRQFGQIGLESLSPITFNDYKDLLLVQDKSFIYSTSFGDLYPYFTAKIRCRGNESNLDECEISRVRFQGRREDNKDDYCPVRKEELASVTCKPNTEIAGKIVLKGGKDSSMGALYIGDAKYGGEASPNVAKVVCRQLGFPHGSPQSVNGDFFFYRKEPKFKRKFECNGSEEKLEDCQLLADINHHPWSSAGIICNSTFKLTDAEMNAKYGETASDFQSYWEIWARYLFIADINGDGKVSREEIKAKIKDILGAILKLLDQNKDGSLSTEDLTALSLRFSDVNDVFTKLFDVLAKGNMEISTKHEIVELINPPEYRHDGTKEPTEEKQITKILKYTLNSNQDEVLERGELINFISMIFGNLDLNQDNVIEWVDVERFLRQSHIFSCLQINEVKIFLHDYIKLIKTQTGKLLDYFFTYLDLNRNGEVTLEEIYKIPMCTPFPRDPNDPHRCYDLLRKFYRQVYNRNFPTLKFPGPELDEKMANSLCTVMQPTM